MNNDNFNPYAAPYQNPMPSSAPNLDSQMQKIAEGMNGDDLPQTAEQYYFDSFSEVLARSIGYFADCEFLIGTGGLVEKYGILFAAGNNFVTLYDRDNDSYTTCDLYSLKFVTFYNTHSRPANFVPRQNGRIAPQNGNTSGNRSMR